VIRFAAGQMFPAVAQNTPANGFGVRSDIGPPLVVSVSTAGRSWPTSC
jgi:hypothetical protein